MRLEPSECTGVRGGGIGCGGCFTICEFGVFVV